MNRRNETVERMGRREPNMHEMTGGTCIRNDEWGRSGGKESKNDCINVPMKGLSPVPSKPLVSKKQQHYKEVAIYQGKW